MYVGTSSNSTTTTPPPSSREDCGLTSYTNPYIIDGEFADDYEFPWMAKWTSLEGVRNTIQTSP